MSARNTTQHDVWTAGDAYEPFVGRWSRRAAREFIAWLALAANSRWLDVGCGTGALTQTILTTAAPCEVLGVDPSEGFVAYARDHTQDSRAKFQVGNAQALPVANSDFDVAVAGLVLNFVPDPARAVTEMHRAVRVGGTVAAYVWDYADGMQLLRRFWDAAVALDPAARELDEGRRFPLCRREALRSLLNDLGLERTEVQAIDVPTVFKNFDDYWSPFLGRHYKTVHRRFQTWCRDEVLRRVLTDVANELRDRGALDEEECFIDATFVMAKGGGAEVGTTKRGKGMKIMAIVDRHGLPLSVSTHAANHHEVRLVQLCFDFYMIEAKPENLIGDRAYDSDPLDEELRRDGVEMIAPHRANRIKPPTQDRRRLSRYMRRWLVERFFAWIQWQRRILVRWEFHTQNFLGFVQLACLVILFRQF